VSDYFDTRLNLLFGRAALLLPPRQAMVADALGRSGMAMPCLATADSPPPRPGRAAPADQVAAIPPLTGLGAGRGD
jgi:hypothetical protein